MKIETENIRSYRLKAHHLEKKLPLSGLADAAGACGVQNSPPGAWETVAPDIFCLNLLLFLPLFLYICFIPVRLYFDRPPYNNQQGQAKYNHGTVRYQHDKQICKRSADILQIF